MSIVDSILAELEIEAEITQRVLDRIPEDKMAWKPHQKSMSLGELSWHLASMPQWIVTATKPDVYELMGGTKEPPPTVKSEIIDSFQKGLVELKAYLGQLDDSAATAMWKATMNGKEVVASPRIAFLRSAMINHTCHHRGQLSVYLRLLDVPVPAIYGSSADEKSPA